MLQDFQPMGVQLSSGEQLSSKAALSLAKRIVTASDHCSNTKPRDVDQEGHDRMTSQLAVQCFTTGPAEEVLRKKSKSVYNMMSKIIITKLKGKALWK